MLSGYGIARSNLHNRTKNLKIESVKQGRKAFLNAPCKSLLPQDYLLGMILKTIFTTKKPRL